MLYVVLQLAACMLLMRGRAEAGGYINGRMRPVRDPATLAHNFRAVDLLPHEQLERVQPSHYFEVAASQVDGSQTSNKHIRNAL
jgi:hypothetical protein